MMRVMHGTAQDMSGMQTLYRAADLPSLSFRSRPSCARLADEDMRSHHLHLDLNDKVSHYEL